MAQTWHILGAGAIGSLLACHLYRCGVGAELLYRNRERLDARGPSLRLAENGSRQGLDIRRGLVGDPGQISGLILCTKAHQALDALHQVQGRLADRCPVILLHNGMGIREQAETFLQPAQLFCGVTTEAAYWNEDGELVYAGRGQTQLGQLGNALAPDWFAALSRALPDTSWYAEIEHSQWRKLLVNCAINPLTAIHGCRNGELPALFSGELDVVIAELAVVAAGLGYGDLADGLRERVLKVCADTAANHSSMLRDIRAHRPGEIEFITGHLCRRATALGIPCPVNASLLQRVRQLEKPGA